jgi:DNA-binding winged helix-turn-helix (wHTH) protein/tetratricopeptide (TPR) repeat protein
MATARGQAAVKARLGSLIVDERKFLLMHGTTRLDVSRKAVELLMLLGRAGSGPVNREVLLQGLWSERDVSDKALSMLVVELRRSLLPYFVGQDPIQTVPGLGYGLSVPYEQCDFPSELASSVTMTRGRVILAVAAPTLLSSGARAAELAACLHDTLLNTLGSEPDLKVSTREATVGEVSEAFTFVIQSSVRVVRREVLLSVRCVNPHGQEICWAASERASLADALDVEIRLCDRLRRELQSAASGSWGRQTWTQYRQSSGFEALVEGHRLMAGRDASAFPDARAKFRHALQLDPSCAPALVGMANCDILDAFYSGVEPVAAAQRAMGYIDRALVLNADLADAHSTRGLIHLAQMRFESAERALLEAVRLDDSSAIAFHWYTDFLASQGRVREAVHVGHLAVARAPRCVVVNGQLGQLLHMAGRFDEAHAQLERVLAIDPLHAGAHSFLGLNLAMRDVPGAVEYAWRAVELAPHAPFYRGVYGSILARTGERDRALQQLHLLETSTSRSAAFAEGAMLVAAALGQTRRAVEWFRLSTSQGAAWALCTPMLPMLAALREEPSFQVLLRSRGMATSSA